jgi:hypothetical protein
MTQIHVRTGQNLDTWQRWLVLGQALMQRAAPT